MWLTKMSGGILFLTSTDRKMLPVSKITEKFIIVYNAV